MNFHAIFSTNFRPVFNSKTKNILLFILLLNAGSVVSASAQVSFQQPATATKANQISAENPIWVRSLFPNKPENTPYAKTYIANLTYAANQFRDLFLKSNFKTEAEFIRILQLNHKQAVDGPSANDFYGGQDSLEDKVKLLVKAVNADPLQAKQVMNDHTKTIGGKFRSEADLDFIPTLLLENYIPDFKKPARTKQILNFSNDVVKILGVPKEGLPVNNFSEWALYHNYPASKYYPYYLKTMQQLMSLIRNCKNCSQQQVIGYLADYYHTGTNAHLFLRVNHSLLMAQVNVILMQMGLNPIPHWVGYPLNLRIDIAAIMVSSANFYPIFVKEVFRQNKNLKF